MFPRVTVKFSHRRRLFASSSVLCALKGHLFRHSRTWIEAQHAHSEQAIRLFHEDQGVYSGLLRTSASQHYFPVRQWIEFTSLLSSA